ncbi:MAG: cation diffusion facilitator family transporter [Polyangiaceae bacterium]
MQSEGASIGDERNGKNRIRHSAASAHAAELKSHAAAAQRAGRIAATVAISLAVGKVIAGQLGHSAAVTASAVDSLMDVLASSANALAIRLAHAEPDRDHPFGHAKIEAVAIAAQGLLIGGSGIYLLVEGVRRALTPEPLRLATVTLGTMAVATVATTLLVLYMGRVARRTGSGAVRADALHYRTDIGANLAVLAGVGVVYLTDIERIDGLLSIGVALYVLISAAGLLRTGVRDLVDTAAPPERLAPILAVLRTFESEARIQGHHALRTRTAGRNIFIEVHIELPGKMPLREAHARGDALCDAITKVDPDAHVLVHVDTERDEPPPPADPPDNGVAGPARES